ncbi:MAG: glycosyltransferase family 2 protein [Clostridia bacterium]|nr:glycosyltransferase family 2 protein [Clostridia bacterium]
MNGWALIRKAASFLSNMGIRATCRKVGQRIRTDKLLSQVRIKPYTAEDIAAQRKAQLDGAATMHIVADVRGVSRQTVQALVDSVQAQTYTDWTLCLVGGDPSGLPTDERICAAEEAEAHGKFMALLAAGVVLEPSALYEAVYAMTTLGAELVYSDGTDAQGKAMYKPDYAPDTLRSMNYIGDMMAMRTALLERAGGIGQDGLYGLTLRLTEQANDIQHIQRLLYTCNEAKTSSAEEDIAALRAHLRRVGLAGRAQPGRVPGTYRQQYEIREQGMVSILIPNKDHTEDLMKCITSLREKTTYPNWEVIIIENNSTETETFACYEQLQQDERIRVVTWKDGFNYAAINNYGETFARGEYLLLLNNDVEIITPEWIEEMLMYAQRPDVGAVGAMLYFPDDTVQHGGVIVGLGGVADHAHKGFQRGDAGYMNRLAVVQNYSAVTAACLLMRRNVFKEIGGFDMAYQVAFNDVDLCMRMGEAGYRIVWTPYAELYHYESKSRGLDETRERYFRYAGEVERFQKRWMHRLVQGDPCYNRNLTQMRTDFSMSGAEG